MRRRAMALAGAIGLAAACCAPAQVEVGARVVVTLSTGERLEGVLLGVGPEAIELDHPALGLVRIPAGRAVSVGAAGQPARSAPQGPPPDPEAPALAPEFIGQTPELDTIQADRTPGPPATAEEMEPAARWTGNLEFGLSGSEGNTDQQSLRVAAHVRRLAAEQIQSITARYRFRLDRGEQTENEFVGKARQEWLLAGSNWSLFAEANGEVNEFRAYEARFSALLGVGYRFIDTERTRLVARLGAGAAYDFDGPRAGWYPEARLSADFSHRFTERLSFTAAAEYTPDLEDLGEFRARGLAGLDLAVDQARRFLIRLGVENRYESASGDREANDLDYFATLLYSF